MCSKQFFLSFLLSQQVLLPTLFASGWIEDRFTASTKKPRVPARGFLFLRGNMLHSSFFCQQYSTTSILDCQILLLAALCSSFLFHKENIEQQLQWSSIFVTLMAKKIMKLFWLRVVQHNCYNYVALRNYIQHKQSLIQLYTELLQS